jgi:hypothetical protein
MKTLQQETELFWDAVVLTDDFTRMASGKEVGHRIADYVEEQTAELLDIKLRTGYQHSGTGKRVDRGMGDVWVHSMGMFNPVNVKSGEIGKNGQPNMVSLKKLLAALLERQIDSYYILVVKFDASNGKAHVYFVDLLDYLDFTHFDSGPGQLMLREKRFYEAVATGYKPPKQSLEEKTSRLLEILKEGDQRLTRNRDSKREKMQTLAKSFDPASPIDQQTLDIR